MKNKKLIQRGLGVILLSLMSLLILLPVFASADNTSTVSLRALGKSGNIGNQSEGENVTYESLQSASVGSGYMTYTLADYERIYIGQGWMEQLGYVINRGYLYFDLSSIPSNATISGATLTLTRTWGEEWDLPQTFHILAFNGQDTNHPSDALANEDYDLSLYADNETTPGWELDTADYTGYGLGDLHSSLTEPFNSTGMDWIETQRNSPGQELRLCLVSDQDWQAIAPISDDQILFDFSSSFLPTLRNLQQTILASVMSPFLDNRLMSVSEEENENYPEIEIEYTTPPPPPLVNSLGGVLPIVVICLYILWSLFFLSGEITLKNIIIVVVGAVIILAFVGTVAGMIALW
jgi:hypothetical protein